MRVFVLGVAVCCFAVSSASGAPGDVWILGIDHVDNPGSFTTYAGAGYSGPQSAGNATYTGKAVGRAGTDGVARVYWALNGLSVNNGATLSTSARLYSIQFFGTAEAGHNDWQPIESQFNGVNGEAYPVESGIPWIGASSTNHQYIAANGADDSLWHSVGPGPHGPESDSQTAGANGRYMWLKAGSWLYAKWDFTFAINRSWSAIQLTEFTPTVSNVLGDYNKNGVVDAADYVVWRKTEGQFGTGLAADGNNDGFVDEYDYIQWRERFGATSGSGLADSSLTAVPEPTAIWLVATLGVAFIKLRRRCTGRDE